MGTRGRKAVAHVWIVVTTSVIETSCCGTPRREHSPPASDRADFFVIGVDFQNSQSFPTWVQRGVNTVVRVPCNVDPCEDVETWTRAAKTNGLKMIRKPRPDPAGDSAEPALLAWSLCDEPENPAVRCHDVCDEEADPNNPVDNLAFLEARYETLHRSGAHPVYLGLTGGLILDANDQVCNGPGDGPVPTGAEGSLTCYPRFLAVSDWVANDIYPGATGEPQIVASVVDKVAQWAPDKPQFVYIGARSGIDGPPDKFRAAIWLSIVHGARGIIYFPMGPCANPTTTAPCPNVAHGMCQDTADELVDEMTRQNARISALAPVLLSPRDPPWNPVIVEEPLQATWRVHGGQVYVIAVNASNQRSERRLRIGGVASTQRLQVLGEGREIVTAPDLSFADSFEPYDVHVYKTTANVVVRRSTGFRFAQSEPWAGPFYGSHGTYFADVTGDAKADAIAVNDDTVTVRPSTGTGFAPNQDWSHGTYFGTHGTFFADVTGDGSADAIVVNDDTVTVRPSTRGDFGTPADWSHGPYFGAIGTYFCNVAKDESFIQDLHTADAIVVNADRVVVRRALLGGDFGPNENWTQEPFFGSRGTFFADVTGDGWCDAIAVNDDTVTVRRSTGSAFGPNEDWTHGPYFGSRGTFFADVNDDRKADAIVVNDDTVTVRLSDIGFGPGSDWTRGPYFDFGNGTFFADVDGGGADAIIDNP